MADAAELNARFAAPAAGDDDNNNSPPQLEPDVLLQLQSIQHMHGLPVQELYYKWEAYCIKYDIQESVTAALTMDRLRAFKQDLQDSLERRNQEHKQASSHVVGGLHVSGSSHKKIKTEPGLLNAGGPGTTPRHAGKTDVFGLLGDILPSTPGARRAAGGGGGGVKLETPSVKRVRGGGVPASSPVGGSSPVGAGASQNTTGENAPATPFSDRAHAGDVLEVFNPQLPAAPTTTGAVPYATSRIKLTSASDQSKLKYRPMAMKLSNASATLDERIEDFADIVMEHYAARFGGAAALGSAATWDTAEIVAVGRIASDATGGGGGSSSNAGGKQLNAASIVLETSRQMGGGLRVPLDLSRLAGYQFFPGQIVALRGSNTTGSAFVVSEVLPLPLLPNAASTPAALAAHRARLAGQGDGEDAMDVDGAEPAPLNVLFASGPYTADDNLDFEPLHALMTVAADTVVDAVVLAGPFIDIDHPLIATGDFDLPEAFCRSENGYNPDVDATMATVFRALVAPAIHRLVRANPAVTVLLVPSVRDAVANHVSWPQAAFSRRGLGLPPQQQVKIVGNPVAVALNEVVLGMSTQDVVYELRHEELAHGRVDEPNAVTRACRYLLEQRHYFPLFPPVDRRGLPRTGVVDDTEDENDGNSNSNGLATGAMLDTFYLTLGEMLTVRPDILLLPSAMPPFARVVESVLMINPGYLSKRRGPGTYARMTLYPPAPATGDAMVGHKVFERARVEITRI